MASGKVIKFVSGNMNKVAEVNAVLAGYNIVQEDIDLPEYQGDAETVARTKCQEAARVAKCAVLIEDTCLCFNAMGGLPGPYIKWFLTSLGPEGLYRMLTGWEDKSAYALCTFAYSNGDPEHVELFQGRIDGHMVEPRGRRDFGWDPCFQPEGSPLTFGEMDKGLKNQISHRALALKKLKEELLPKL